MGAKQDEAKYKRHLLDQTLAQIMQCDESVAFERVANLFGFPPELVYHPKLHNIKEDGK